jgi:hypothetical protein
MTRRWGEASAAGVSSKTRRWGKVTAAGVSGMTAGASGKTRRWGVASAAGVGGMTRKWGEASAAGVSGMTYSLPTVPEADPQEELTPASHQDRFVESFDAG